MSDPISGHNGMSIVEYINTMHQNRKRIRNVRCDEPAQVEKNAIKSAMHATSSPTIKATVAPMSANLQYASIC